MRISTSQQYYKSIDQMQRNQANLSRLSDQVSTGKKLSKPSDDPVAAAQVVKLERELSQYEKFEDNINVTTRRLELEDSILDSVNTALDRIRELTIQAGNMATLNDQDRLGISKELIQQTDYLAGLMNTQDSEGEYLFAGSKGSTKPYQELPGNRYVYQGDDGQRSIQVGSQLYMPSNDSGQALFEGIDGDLKVNMTGKAVANNENFITNIQFADHEAEKTFEKQLDRIGGEITIKYNGTNYTLTDSAGDQVLDEQGNTVALNITSTASGSTAELFGATFDLSPTTSNSSAPNNEITLTAKRDKINILEATVDLAEALAKPLDSDQSRTDLRASLDKALDQFVQGQDSLLQGRTVVGTRLSTLEGVTTSNGDFKFFTEKALSYLVDVDAAEAISKFKLQEVTLQAAQATFSRVSQLSLFDYLR